MTQPEETIRDDQRTWAESLESAARYFTHTEGGAFRFAVTNDELVQRRFNAELQQVLRGKGTPVQIHDWSKASPPDMYPAEQLRQLKAAHPETKGIICIGLERAMRDSPEMLTLLNFAREALSEVGVPILFWISFRTLPLMNRFAIDLYNQRIGANLYFEHDTESADTDGSAMRFIAHETVAANQDLRPLEARLKLLEKQFDELKKLQSPEKLANDIVMELLALYVKIPGSVNMIQSLVDEYGKLIDLDNADYCFILADAYRYLGSLEKAHSFYQNALTHYHLLAEKNPQAWLPRVADILNNLSLLLTEYHDYQKAEMGLREALKIRRVLASDNPRIYLSEVAGTLSNLGLLQLDRKELIEAEKNFKEALEIYRELAVERPQLYLAFIARTQNNLALLQYERHELTNAEQSIREALEIYRELKDSNPQVYLSDIAMALNNLALVQCDRSDFVDAEKNYMEVLSIWRELSGINPQVYQQNVAKTLINLAILHQSNIPDREKSLACSKEALSILLPLVETQPPTIQPFMSAVHVIKNWDLDPDEFITNLKKSAAESSPESR